MSGDEDGQGGYPSATPWNAGYATDYERTNCGLLIASMIV
jgi:hypothetical protein